MNEENNIQKQLMIRKLLSFLDMDADSQKAEAIGEELYASFNAFIEKEATRIIEGSGKQPKGLFNSKEG